MRTQNFGVTNKEHYGMLWFLLEWSIMIDGSEKCNRPFYRYDGHIELIRFKEYYRMPRGHEHILFVCTSAFGTFFLKVFLE